MVLDHPGGMIARILGTREERTIRIIDMVRIRWQLWNMSSRVLGIPRDPKQTTPMRGCWMDRVDITRRIPASQLITRLGIAVGISALFGRRKVVHLRLGLGIRLGIHLELQLALRKLSSRVRMLKQCKFSRI